MTVRHPLPWGIDAGDDFAEVAERASMPVIMKRSTVVRNEPCGRQP